VLLAHYTGFSAYGHSSDRRQMPSFGKLHRFLLVRATGRHTTSGAAGNATDKTVGADGETVGLGRQNCRYTFVFHEKPDRGM
jgi:hypothetical protein